MVFCKIDYCIHILWFIFMGLGHNDPWVESHMWPQHTWGQRSSRGQWTIGSRFWKKIVTVSTYFDVFSCDLDTMILGKCHTCDLNSLGGQRSSRGQWPLVQVFGMGSNLILHWLQKYVIVKAGETCGSRTALLSKNVKMSSFYEAPEIPLTIFVSPELSSVRDYVITHSVRSMYVVRSMCIYVVICKIDHCIHIHWCIPMGLGHNDPWVESHMWPQQTWGQRSSRGQWPLVQVFGKKGQCIHILWCIFKSNITMIAKVCDRESRWDSWFENRLVEKEIAFWG